MPSGLCDKDRSCPQSSAPKVSDSSVFAQGILLLELLQTFPWCEEGILSDFDYSRWSALSNQCKSTGDGLMWLFSHLMIINRQGFSSTGLCTQGSLFSLLFHEPTK